MIAGERLLQARAPFKALAVLGAVSIAAGLALDGMAGRRLWPSTPLELVRPQSEADAALITFSGLGCLAGRQQSQDMAPLFPRLAPAHWEYSSDGFSIDALARELRYRMPTLRRAGVNGHSMGGPAGLETLRRAGVPELGPVVLHCSPFDMDDVRHAKAARLTKLARIPLGPGTKAAFSFTRSLLDGQKVPVAFRQARTDAVTGSSLPLWLGQMNELPKLRLSSFKRQYGDMVVPGTEAWYCMPEDPAHDTTINTTQASERFGAFFAAINVPYHIVTVPESGHADVTRGAAVLAAHTALLAHAELAA